jgi:hypothetical protein
LDKNTILNRKAPILCVTACPRWVIRIEIAPRKTHSGRISALPSVAIDLIISPTGNEIHVGVETRNRITIKSDSSGIAGTQAMRVIVIIERSRRSAREIER